VGYSIQHIDKKTINQCTLSREGKIETDHNLFLPVSNPFIPQRLATQNLEYISKIPLLQKGQDTLSVWYRSDNYFKTPRASFYFNIMSPFANKNSRSVVLTEIFVCLINAQLNKIVYPAGIAGLEYSLYRHIRGISVKVNGFEDYQSALLNQLFLNSEIIPDITTQSVSRTLTLKTPYLRTIEVDHSNSDVSVYFQGRNDTVIEIARMMFLSQLIEAPYYHNLRIVHRVGI